MPLLNDGPISQLEDLRAYESSVLDTASVEGVPLSPKIDMAQREVSTELLRYLISQLEPAESVTPAYLAKVAVTDPLLRWHSLHTLELFFRDVHHQQINDRYKAKWEAYAKEALAARRLLYEVGVGLVDRPLPRPATPTAGNQTGNNFTSPLLIRATWVATGIESAPSDAVLYDPAQFNGGGPSAWLTSTVPAGAVGWNVYAGIPDSALTKQNSAPLGIGDVWVIPGGGLVTGALPPTGQSPDRYVRVRRNLLRG